jgi:hypothetical protein
VPKAGPLESGVTNALTDTPLLARDQATADLARHYARLIDAAPPDTTYDVAGELGPKLLAALAALGMTPSSRNTKNGGTSAPVVSDELAALRGRADKRRTRQR